MNNKIIKKFMVVISCFICFVMLFGFEASAYKFLDESISGISQGVSPDFSSTPIELNINKHLSNHH